MYVLIYLMDISMRKSMLHWSRKHTVHWSISGGWLWLKLGQEFIFQPQEFPQLYYHSLKERTIMSVFIVQLIGVWTTVRAETHRGFPLLPVNTVRLAEQVSKQKRELFFSHWCQRHLLGWSGILDISPRLQLIQPWNTFKKRGHSCSPTFSTSSRSTLVQNILRVGGAARGKSTKIREEFSSSLWGNRF